MHVVADRLELLKGVKVTTVSHQIHFLLVFIPFSKSPAAAVAERRCQKASMKNLKADFPGSHDFTLESIVIAHHLATEILLTLAEHATAGNDHTEVQRLARSSDSIAALHCTTAV